MTFVNVIRSYHGDQHRDFAPVLWVTAVPVAAAIEILG